MSPDPESELAKLERAWMAAWMAKDLATCERILDDEFLLTSARGVLMPKSDWLAAAMGPFVCESFEWEEMRVRPFGGMAIVHSRTRQRASVAGQDWSGVFLLTDVWLRREDSWKVVSRHGTGPLPDSL
jgi:ketosteroid isomerase-like protein